jgi:hypothetical protein
LTFSRKLLNSETTGNRRYTMAVTVVLPDDVFARIASMARPFVDKEPADVIRWLVEKEAKVQTGTVARLHGSLVGTARVSERAPRERGATIDIDGKTIRAESVPELCSKVMELLFEKGMWNKVLEMAPYRTSSERYLFAKTPKHPNGNDFWVEVKCRGLYVEAHKNYKTAIEQLARLVAKCGMTLTYKGT